MSDPYRHGKLSKFLIGNAVVVPVDDIQYYSVADPGGEGAMAPSGPVKISHKKNGCRRRPHRFHVSRPPYLAVGSATVIVYFVITKGEIPNDIIG